MPELSDEPVYYISVASRLLQCHPQTLRTYERLGLLSPRRSGSNVRLYSERDIERSRQIQRLTQEMGVNLAGVEVVLKLLDQIDAMNAEIERLREYIEHGPKKLPAGNTVRIEIQTER
ncbi:helix-turn-helix transcriptional regulator [bacterium]|nr:helix-turn-helix transcriptional regulator [bacterium]